MSWGLWQLEGDLYRLTWRAAFRERMDNYLKMILEGDGKAHPLLVNRSIDDGIRYQSNVFAVGKAYDKLALMVSALQMVSTIVWCVSRCDKVLSANTFFDTYQVEEQEHFVVTGSWL